MVMTLREIQTPASSMESSQVAGIIASLGAAAIAWVKFQRAVSNRPLFENGERDAVRKALSIIMAANKDNRERIDRLEFAQDTINRENDREHDRLHLEIRSLKLQMKELLDAQVS